jgi:hypothetical protein
MVPPGVDKISERYQGAGCCIKLGIKRSRAAPLAKVVSEPKNSPYQGIFFRADMSVLQCTIHCGKLAPPSGRADKATEFFLDLINKSQVKAYFLLRQGFWPYLGLLSLYLQITGYHHV